MSELAKQLSAKQGTSLRLVPCTVTTVTPLRVDINGTSIAGVKIAGLTYTTGAANALWAPPALPVILPIGA